jgi:DNA-binding transcriptional regulator YiaG
MTITPLTTRDAIRRDIRALRRQLELTQAQVAARFGCCPQAIASYESGKRRLSDAEAKRLIAILEEEQHAQNATWCQLHERVARQEVPILRAGRQA